MCRHVYARVERGAVAVFDVESKEALHRILNEWADIILRASICWWISRQRTDARGAGSSEEVLSCGSGNLFEQIQAAPGHALRSGESCGPCPGPPLRFGHNLATTEHPRCAARSCRVVRPSKTRRAAFRGLPRSMVCGEPAVIALEATWPAASLQGSNSA